MRKIQCPECRDLWQRYAQKTTTYASLLKLHQKAVGTSDWLPVVDVLASVAAEHRQAKEALTRHEAEIHGQTFLLQPAGKSGSLVRASR
jgi:hypothetical protein